MCICVWERQRSCFLQPHWWLKNRRSFQTRGCQATAHRLNLVGCLFSYSPELRIVFAFEKLGKKKVIKEYLMTRENDRKFRCGVQGYVFSEHSHAPSLRIVCMASTRPRSAWASTTDTGARSPKGLHLALYGSSLPTPRLDHLRLSFQSKALTLFKNKTNSITEFMDA